jgi:periplasmic protein CpxP/Spy
LRQFNDRDVPNMRATPRAIVGLIAAAALASVSAIALAQAAPPAGSQAGPPTAEQRAAWHAKAEARMHEHTEMHARHLHDLLQLRPDQDAALQTLMAALASSHMDHMGDHHMGAGGPGHMDHHMGPGADGHDDFAKLTTPERLDKMAAMMSEHMARRQAEFQKHAAAIKAFYAVLSPEQKRAFDATPRHMFGGMHGRHDGEGHGGWGHHMGAGRPHGAGGPGAPPPPQ